MADLRSETSSDAGLLVKPLEIEGTTKIVNLFHEWMPTPQDTIVEETIRIDRLAPPERIVVRSHVISHASNQLSSPEYLASVRRRRSAQIAKLIQDLEQHAQKADLPVWTHQPLDQLRFLIQQLSDAEQFRAPEHEGNSCEILRQVRDTFLGTGWEAYRKQTVRDGVVKILLRLSEATEVVADDTVTTMDELLDLDLNPSVGLRMSHGEEETKVSD